MEPQWKTFDRAPYPAPSQGPFLTQLTVRSGTPRAACCRKRLSANDLSDRALDGCRPTIIPWYQVGDYFEIATP